MRRGLMSWSKSEVPVEALELRVQRLQAAMAAADLGAVLIHTTFARPAAAHWLTNFTPYWSEALLMVWPDGLPTLLAALTPRVHTWMREVSHLGELVSAPKLAAVASQTLEQRLGQGRAVGVVGLDSLPWSIGGPLSKALAAERLRDASGLFAGVRQPADAVERALGAKATAIANDALQAAAAQRFTSTSQLAAALESSARNAGAEEVLHRVAPDLAESAVLRRLEGELPLAATYAVELSVAYKGVWTRVGQPIANGATPDSWSRSQHWFDAASAALSTSGAMPNPSTDADSTSWQVESCIGLDPLSIVGADSLPSNRILPKGSTAVLSATLRTAGGHWFAAARTTIGSVSEDNR